MVLESQKEFSYIRNDIFFEKKTISLILQSLVEIKDP